MSDDQLEAVCRDRLERHGLAEVTSLHELVTRLEAQLTRRIRLHHDGIDGHLPGFSAAVTASRTYDPIERVETLRTAEPVDTYQGQGQLLHEIGHVIIEPNGSDSLVRAIQAEVAGTSTSVTSYRCDRQDRTEREVELTAHLLRVALARDTRRRSASRSGFNRLLSGQ